ncbi:3-oxoacyl-[acyl-carrier-protein] synthase NodE [Mesorhizobium albiziae]|uniref:Nodulation protein E n=1 Tax=Neomesorhizobium albiziae TaxID=335020 RepID=A0A1I3ZPM8_9HYPH|nr:beta-ketoacyl-[acyl-carrier-protein] synthase family protein [Mesorhizobium albiziae]GLS32301.1 beta-ACP synthase [Mesorhizobium albiziae]SFK46055.1 3-oxoacyl-[acyl-carrier-protein] synthase NodE [Mesorhizobium albiziae]
MDRRVVITGMGGLCGLGTDAASIWTGMREGRSAIGPIVNSEFHELRVRIGAEIKALPEHDIDGKQLVSMDRFSVLAVLAAREAMRQAGLSSKEGNTYRFGATVGVGGCGWDAIEQTYRALLLGGKRAALLTVPKAMPGAATGQVSMSLGLRGPVFGVTSACSSANHAIASAVDQIRLGRADVMLAGGSEAPLIWGVLKAWESIRVLSPDTCRPFSADRQGLVLGEGASMAVLESYEHAAARGATMLAEIAGIGLSADASDIVAPTVEGPEAAMRACLADAGLAATDVDYLNAHGTGTKANDQIETAAIKRVFGQHAYSMSISSTKSMHAHCLGASGALELIACVMAIRESVVPPTANYRELDPDCDLDVTPNVPRERKVRVALSNAFAFGGTNAVLAFRQV